MIAFSNAPIPDHWERWPLTHHDDPCRAAKRPKILPWDFLSDWDRCLWIDANLQLLRHPKTIRADIGLHKHRHRDCVYAEAAECIRLNKDDPDTISAQMQRYYDDGYPAHSGLWECGIMMRRNTPSIEALCRDWWAEIEAGSRRDQLSFPVVLNRHNIRPYIMGNNYRRSGWVKRIHL